MERFNERRDNTLPLYAAPLRLAWYGVEWLEAARPVPTGPSALNVGVRESTAPGWRLQPYANLQIGPFAAAGAPRASAP